MNKFAWRISGCNPLAEAAWPAHTCLLEKSCKGMGVVCNILSTTGRAQLAYLGAGNTKFRHVKYLPQCPQTIVPRIKSRLYTYWLDVQVHSPSPWDFKVHLATVYWNPLEARSGKTNRVAPDRDPGGKAWLQSCRSPSSIFYDLNQHAFPAAGHNTGRYKVEGRDFPAKNKFSGFLMIGRRRLKSPSFRAVPCCLFWKTWH